MANESVVVENASFFSFDRYIFRTKSPPLALHVEIYTASRGSMATARLVSDITVIITSVSAGTVLSK